MAAVDSLGPFGKLPPEIRNRIYELVVPAKSVVKLHAVKRSGKEYRLHELNIS